MESMIANSKIVFNCCKCQCKLYMDNDDYFCPSCKKLFCFICIEKHGCKIQIKPNKYIFQKWKVIEVK